MIYTVAPDWSAATMACSECGAKVTAELRADERERITAKRFGMWLTREAALMRKTLEDQLATQLHRLGCPHVGESG